MSQEFGELNLEEIQVDASRLNPSEKENYLDQFINIPNPKPGQTITFPVRLLPPRKDAKLFQYTRLHLINGRKYQCPRPLVNGKWDYKVPCPICDYYNSLYRQIDKLKKLGKQAEWKKIEVEARNIKPIERYYYNSVARKMFIEGKGEVLNVGPRILSVGKVLHKLIVGTIVGGDGIEKLGNVTNVKSGYDFVIKKELRGSGDDAYPNYDRSIFAREQSPAGSPEEIARWVENLHDLTLNRKPTEPEVLEKNLAIYLGLIPDDKEGFDVDSFAQKYNTNGHAKTPEVTHVTPPPKPSEEVSIEDKEFLESLEAMKTELV